MDALNLTLKTGRVSKTIEVSPEIFLDLDKNGNPLYLEIIGASEKMGKKNFSKITASTSRSPLPTPVRA